MKKITIYAEIKDNKLDETAYELISKAYHLKEKAKTFNVEDNDYEIEVVAIGANLTKSSIASAYCCGCNNFVLLRNSNFIDFYQNEYADTFLDYYRQNPSEIILFPATPIGRMLAPKITTALDTGLVADCTELDFILDRNNQIKLAPTRPTFGSQLMATIISKKNPQCATIRPKTFSARFEHNTEGGLIQKEVFFKENEANKLLRSFIETDNNKINFSNAKVVLAGGYGLKSKDNEYFKKLKELAKLTNATYATTRKTVDFGLEESIFQIGQTGSTVEADVYVAFGISGAIQHIMGMKNSKTIVAVNTDPNAEIFKYCDYKVVADAKVIIDEMLEILK